MGQIWHHLTQKARFEQGWDINCSQALDKQTDTAPAGQADAESWVHCYWPDLSLLGGPRRSLIPRPPPAQKLARGEANKDTEEESTSLKSPAKFQAGNLSSL